MGQEVNLYVSGKVRIETLKALIDSCLESDSSGVTEDSIISKIKFNPEGIGLAVLGPLK